MTTYERFAALLDEMGIQYVACFDFSINTKTIKVDYRSLAGVARPGRPDPMTCRVAYHFDFDGSFVAVAVQQVMTILPKK